MLCEIWFVCWGKVQGPAFVGESWVCVGSLLLDENMNICFGNVVGYHIILCDGREMVEGCVIILVAFDPNPINFDGKLLEFCSDVTKKIKIRLLGFEGLCTRDCVQCQFAVKTHHNGSFGEVVLIAESLQLSVSGLTSPFTTVCVWLIFFLCFGS